MVYNKSDNLAKLFAFKQCKIAANQIECFRQEQRSVNKFLPAEKCKACEIYRRMCNVNKEACFIYKYYQRAEHGFATTRLYRKKQSLEWKLNDSPAVSEESEGKIVDNASYCQLFRQNFVNDKIMNLYAILQF